MSTFVKEYENYILSDKREETLMSIIPGSEADIYLQLTKYLREYEEKKGKNDSNNYDTLLKKLENLNRNAFMEVKFKKLLKSFDFADNETDKEKIIKELKNLICPNERFNYTRPTNSKINLNENSENSKFPNQLDQNLIFSIDKILEKFYQNQDINSINKMSQLNLLIFLKNLNWDKINTDNFFRNWLINQCIQIPVYEDENNVIEKIAKFLDAEADKNKSFPYNDIFLRSLPIELLHKLSDLIKSDLCDKNYILNIIINKKYEDKLFKAKDNLTKRDLLMEIYKSIKNFPLKYQALISNNLLEILNLNVLLNQYDLSLFLEYIKYPVQANSSVFAHTKDAVKILSSQQRYQINGVNNTNSDNKVVSDHLQYFFLHNNTNIKTFEDLIERNYLQKIYHQCLVQKGEENEESIKLLGQSEYEKLINKTEIKICKHNKENFSIEEEVQLDLDIKNVQTLFIKIFEINTENYYYTQKQTFDTSLSLEGLVACSDETFVFNEKPQIKKRKNFNLSGIPKKRGLYIVEFIGGGYSSRAIVKKGNLSIINRETSFGKSIFILNEKSEICFSEKQQSNSDNQIEGTNSNENNHTTGVWFKGTFHPAGENGLVLIPYGKSYESDICIINHDGFSELTRLELNMEQYTLSGAFQVNHESLTIGNTAKFIFKALLSLNGRDIPLSKLKNCTLTAIVSKLVNGEIIPTSQIFEKINFEKNQEYTFELQIPPKLKEISLTFEGEIMNNSKQEKQKLTHSYNYKNYENEEHFIKSFLRKTIENDYELFVLGKNGEPKVECMVNIELKNKLTNNFQDPVRLQTDKNGRILLGKLENIITISVSLTDNENTSIKEKWDLSENKNFLYPANIDILENESIKIPVDFSDLKKTKVLLYKHSTNDLILSFQNDKINLKSLNEENNRFIMEINNLENGNYVLDFENNSPINIRVHQGKYWDSEDFIITEGVIYQNKKASQKVLSISDLKINETNNEIKLKLINTNENTRLHIYSYQFINPCKLSFFNNLVNLYSLDSSSKFSTQEIQKWKNIYLDSRKLNDEIQYVFDRKNLERHIGNSLEKPSLLLKRKYIRDTVTEKEILEKGTNYEKKNLDMTPQQKRNEKAHMMADTMYRNEDYECYDSQKEYNNRCNSTPPAPKNYQNSILSFNNFLFEPAQILVNIPVTEDGKEIVINNINLKNYSQLQIFAVNENNCYEEKVCLKEKEINKRDLFLKDSLDSQNSYAELRITELYLDKSELKIEDITSTSFKIMDSLEKIVFYKLLLNQNLQSKWLDFKFLLNFNELSEEEQKNKITKYFSHELNIFLFFKYPALFEKYILPILKFKAEKTFLDFFLMNDLENLTKYTTPNKINELSVFEKCLLILAIRDENEKLAKEISNLIESETLDIKNETELKKYFDILMNMKNEDDENSAKNALLEGGFLESNIVLQNAPIAPRMMMARMCKKADLSMMKCKGMKSIICEQELDSDMFEDYTENEENRNIGLRKNFEINAGVSKEFCETHFLEGVAIQKNMHVSSNKYWADLAAYWSDKTNSKYNFLSKNIILNTTNLSDLLFTLTVLDLPFRSKNHKFSRYNEMGLKINSDSNLILFTKTIKESNSDIDNNLIIAQSVYLNNFSIMKNSENKNVTEFVPNRIYCHKTNVINLSPKKINFDILIQIPQGSIPIRNSDYTKTINQNLENNICEFLTYFYFPKEGEFTQYPPTASKEGVIITKGNPMKYNVKNKIDNISSENLDDVLESGSKDDILNFFMKQKLIKEKDLEKIYWIMIEKNFYEQITSLLRKKGIYDKKIWLMGFLHNNETCIKEYIENCKEYTKLVGCNFNSKLLNVDDSNNYDVFNHLDYHPLLNARVHKIGQQNKLNILNREFRNTYQAFIVNLISKREISSKDYLRLSYYLILQDRIDEANNIFLKIQKSEINKYSSLEIQYDYINAYLDFSVGYPKFSVSRSLCRKYKDFPLEQ